ncbi:MAG: hypothetical protein IH822_07105 [Chloroflexi bacterium]|nr:hypothetical protein [Chloroflexota bacterium]
MYLTSEPRGAGIKQRSLVIGSFATFFLVVAVFAAACGGDDAREYFRQLQVLSDDLDERLDALPDPSEEASEEEMITGAQGYLGGAASILEETLAELDIIDRREEVEDAHVEFVEAFLATQQLFQEFADRAPEVESRSELDELLAEFNERAVTIGDRLFDACIALEAMAEDEGVDIELRCEI